MQQHRGANGAGVASVVVTVVVTPLGDAEVQVVVMVFDMMLFQNENTPPISAFFFYNFRTMDMNSFPFSAGAEGEEVHQHADGTVSKTLHTPWVYVEPDGTAHLAHSY